MDLENFLGPVPSYLLIFRTFNGAIHCENHITLMRIKVNTIHSGDFTIEPGSKSLLEAFEAFLNKIYVKM